MEFYREEGCIGLYIPNGQEISRGRSPTDFSRASGGVFPNTSPLSAMYGYYYINTTVHPPRPKRSPSGFALGSSLGPREISWPCTTVYYCIATTERSTPLKLLIFYSRDLWLGSRLDPGSTQVGPKLDTSWTQVEPSLDPSVIQGQIFQLYILLLVIVIITSINLLEEISAKNSDMYKFSQEWGRI